MFIFLKTSGLVSIKDCEKIEVEKNKNRSKKEYFLTTGLANCKSYTKINKLIRKF